MTERDKSRYTEGSVNIGECRKLNGLGSVVESIGQEAEGVGYHPDHCQIDLRLFNLGSIAPFVASLEQNIYPRSGGVERERILSYKADNALGTLLAL
ncbi:hypothetical protein EVAR_30561_1 [Eumeta japonica]|uniref:Uncharacterized protein n=1 Tax=Eumeta variegata TaxID=151549 RepID=A0A4C1VQ13_EUMVA|nr:hypothetical protein EVAR_30561_1 [Eumeta japonica]